MKELYLRRKKGGFFTHAIALKFIALSIFCILLVIILLRKLPDASLAHTGTHDQKISRIRGVSNARILGKFGEMMLDMLPHDLAFTLFVPSQKAFERDLRLQVNDSLDSKEWDNTCATVSRILGFSAVPRKIFSGSVSGGKEKSFDSISGFTLYISKEIDGVIVVNGVRSERVNLEEDEVVVHVMDGVIMDAEFKQSVVPNDDDDNEGR